MKTCSKCKRELEESQFVKSSRYLDGLYPSCKECRKVVRLAWLEKYPICGRCKTNPHMPYSAYCSPCSIAIQDVVRGHPKKFSRRPSRNDGLCPECGVSPKPKERGHCVKCKNKRQYSKLKEQGGQWNLYTSEQRIKVKARRLLSYYVQVGKIERKPCFFCGNLKVEGHHDDHSKPLEVLWVCSQCHNSLERFLKYRLTKKSESPTSPNS